MILSIIEFILFCFLVRAIYNIFKGKSEATNLNYKKSKIYNYKSKAIEPEPIQENTKSNISKTHKNQKNNDKDEKKNAKVNNHKKGLDHKNTNTKEDPKSLFYRGKELWLSGKFNQAKAIFEKCYLMGDSSDPYTYVCEALYFYENAPVGSEHDKNNKDYFKMISAANAYMVAYSNKPDPLVLYLIGDSAAKLGTANEKAHNIHPIYESLYRYLAFLNYTYIIKNHNEIEELINKYQSTAISVKLESLKYFIGIRDKQLTKVQNQEIINLLDSCIKDNGYIHYLLTNIYDYSQENFKNIQESLKNSNDGANLIIFLTSLCSLISEAVINDTDISEECIEEGKSSKEDNDDILNIYFYPDGSKYIGEFKDGKPNGKGTISHSDGSVYEGEVKNGKRHGKGLFKFSDGGVYKGEYISNLRNGYGVHIYSNGNRYEGEFKDDYKHGQGVYRSVDGDVYNGEWKKGKRDGKCTVIFPNGARYEGEFKNDKPYGDCNYTFVTGERYKGEALPDGNLKLRKISK
ncbi:MAG: MORN repeat-containing protein [bacterium]